MYPKKVEVIRDLEPLVEGMVRASLGAVLLIACTL